MDKTELERLALLAEEAAEVIAIVGKILRHGYESHNPDNPTAGDNRAQLESELGDLTYVIDLMVAAADVSRAGIRAHREVAANKKPQYLHHQQHYIMRFLRSRDFYG